MSKRIVIALGGNALGNTAAEQLQLVTETAKSIVDLIAAGNEVVVAHGNGPQVGMINLGLSTALPGKLDTVSASIVIIGIICKHSDVKNGSHRKYIGRSRPII